MLPAFETSEGFCFLFEFLYNFDFQTHKTHPGFVFRILFIVRLSISLMATLSV